MRAAFIIAGKDLRQHLRNTTMLLFALVLPLGLAFLFGSVLNDAGSGFHARFVVADEDHGPSATAFIDGTLVAVAKASTVDIQHVDTATEAARRVGSGKVDAAFVIPAGFSADTAAGRTATLRVIGGAGSEIASYMAREVAQAYAADVRSGQLAVAVTRAGGVEVGDPQQLAGRTQATQPELTLRTEVTAYRKELGTSTYYAAGSAVFFLFFVAMLSINGILLERGNATMTRLVVAPVPRPAILTGKLLSGVIIGLIAMTVLVATSTLLLGADWGDPLGVALLIVSLVLASTGLMALIASVAHSSEHGTNWMSGVTVLLGIFGGSFTPKAHLGPLAWLGYLTPHRWFLTGLSDLAGDGLRGAVVPVLVLLGVAAATFGLTLLRVGKVLSA
ncbi:ABC transporter permease [Longispora fulva]|uniref:ABC-2 type transport system permease protein n=1 Tax=Longispora fulva TaxID=619741 RepID=A0A8J7GM80_9ACTN|nr:ABC transporter permease [Longispora fulva]MBG6135614.1 ABC-2 type transport system permease protein [Longispora fulva]